MKYSFTIMFLLAVCYYSNAQFSEGKIISQCIPCGPQDVHLHDFNEDGLEDILTIGFANGEVIIFWNEGNGQFSEHDVIVDSDFFTAAIFPGDFNNDGLPDIAIAEQYGVGIAWIMNEGDGEFGPLQYNSGSYSPQTDIETADIDGDGWIDLVTSSSSSSSVSWYKNEEGQGFSSERELSSVMHGSLSVTTGDVDNDGDIDIVTAADRFYVTSLTWFRNDGNEQFTLQDFPIVSGIPQQQVVDIKLGDMDNDGDLDLVSTTFADNQVRWHKNDDSGNFDTPIVISSSLNNPTGVDLADLDNDGNLDIIIASSGSNGTAVVRNNGDNSFSPAYFLNMDMEYSRMVHSADLNNDGLLDIVSISVNDSEITGFLNMGDFDFFDFSIADPRLSGLQLIELADMNNDNYKDLIAYAQGDGELVYMPYDEETDSFGEGIDVGPHSYPVDIKVADLDGNGYNDVITIDGQTSRIYWFPGMESGFSSRQIVDVSFIIYSLDLDYSLKVEDVDSDGDMDVLAVSEYENKVIFYKNFGTGTFAPEQIITSSWGTGKVLPFVKDFNADGHNDIFIAFDELQKVSVFLGNGNGNFGTENILLSGVQNIDQLAAIDMNGDSFNDLLVLSDGALEYYLNNTGSSINNSPLTLTEDDLFQYFQIEDINNDNRDDVAIFTKEPPGDIDGRVLVSYANEEGDFTTPELLTTFEIPDEVPNTNLEEYAFIDDFDGDHDFDLFYYQIGYTFLAWRENLTVVSTQDIPLAKRLIAYPNPYRSHLTISGEGWTTTPNKTINLYSSAGQHIKQVNVDASGQPIMPNLPTGTYFLECKNEQGEPLGTITVMKQ